MQSSSQALCYQSCNSIAEALFDKQLNGMTTPNKVTIQLLSQLQWTCTFNANVLRNQYLWSRDSTDQHLE